MGQVGNGFSNQCSEFIFLFISQIVSSCGYTVPTFNSCTKYAGSQGIVHDRIPDCHHFPGYGCMDDLTTERSFDSQASCVINVFGLFFDILPMGARKTRLLQTSGRLVQELNVCTVVFHVWSRGTVIRLF